MIKNIEIEHGVELVNRHVTPLTLTYAGERYLSYMKEIEEKYVKMKHEFEAISDLKKGRLTLGINPTLASYTLYKFLPKFIKAYRFRNRTCRRNRFRYGVLTFRKQN